VVVAERGPGRQPGQGVAALATVADPVLLRRLSIVVAEDEVCSCELQEPLAKSQPIVSHQTKTLAEAGLIVGHKRSKWMWWPTASTPSERS
jgi:ArsR family transcriptional regulator